MTTLKGNQERLTVKLAGGATAQTLALMNAIYLRNKNSKDFQLKYFPYSTGTFWPFAIKFLLREGELLDDSVRTVGLKNTESLSVGKIIRSHPLAAKKFSYERILSVIRFLKLEEPLQRIRGERALLASINKLEKVTRKASAVSGGFVPILNSKVNLEMDERFKNAGKKSPFSKDQSFEHKVDVAIHYRIGDKRAKFSHPADFGGDGVTDPEIFKFILEKASISNKNNIYVLSDEPKIAQQLLEEVGIRAKLNPVQGDIWEDLYFISQAKTFLGSWSQVSQLASICVLGNGGQAFLPSTTQVGTKIQWYIPEINYFEPKFLDSSHPIYKPDFDLDKTAHSSYKGINSKSH